MEKVEPSIISPLSVGATISVDGNCAVSLNQLKIFAENNLSGSSIKSASNKDFCEYMGMSYNAEDWA